MANINYEGKTYEMDGDGFMLKPEEWTEGLAAEIAKEDGINELTENHWKILHCIRENYEEKGIAPMVRVICKALPVGSRPWRLPCGRSSQTRRLRVVAFSC